MAAVDIYHNFSPRFYSIDSQGSTGSAMLNPACAALMWYNLYDLTLRIPAGVLAPVVRFHEKVIRIDVPADDDR